MHIARANWQPQCVPEQHPTINHIHCVSGVPETTFRSSDLLGKLTGVSIQPWSWLWFVPTKGHSKISKDKRIKRQSQEATRPGFQQEVPQDALNFTSYKLWNVVCHRSSLETQDPGFLLETQHINTLCQAHTNIQDSQKQKHVFSINHIVPMNGLAQWATLRSYRW